MTEEAQNFEYATEADLPVKKKFSTTRKAGYVEDEVDVWVEETVAKYTDFLNRYNNLVYQHGLLQAAYAELEETVANGSTEAAAEPETAVETPAQAEEPSVEEATPVVETAPEPTVTVDVTSASRRAREIMDEAAAEAAEHVSRALDRVGRIEAEAEAEAAAIRLEAQNEVAQIVSAAKAEASEIRDEAVTTANRAIELKNHSVQERDAIFERLELFYSSQLEEIRTNKGSVGYSPLISVNGEELDLPVETEEASTGEYSAAADEYVPENVTEAVTVIPDASVYENTPAPTENVSYVTEEAETVEPVNYGYEATQAVENTAEQSSEAQVDAYYGYDTPSTPQVVTTPVEEPEAAEDASKSSVDENTQPYNPNEYPYNS